MHNLDYFPLLRTINIIQVVTDTNLSKPFKKEDRNTNTKSASLFLISLLSLSVLVPWLDKSATNAFGSTISNTGSNNTIVLSNPEDNNIQIPI